MSEVPLTLRSLRYSMMPNHDDTPRPAELVYVSESKLFGLARAHNIAVSWLERETAFEGAGRLAGGTALAWG